jgi:Transglutaminase-like superfamily
MLLRSDARKLLRHRWPECLILLEAFLLLGAGRAAVLLFSFSRVAGWLGLRQVIVEEGLDTQQSNTASRIGWVVGTASLRTPWASTCLVQTLAAAMMLRRRRIPFALCLGVARNADHIIAHAWLRCGDAILTGSNGHERFAQISTFSLAHVEPSLIRTHT